MLIYEKNAVTKVHNLSTLWNNCPSGLFVRTLVSNCKEKVNEHQTTYSNVKDNYQG